MGNFVRHTNCPNCGSKDNLAMYDDGSYYCFSGCGYTKVSDGFRLNSNKHSSKVKEKGLQIMSTKEIISEEKASEVKLNTTFKGSNFRGIRDETFKYFGVRNKIDEEGSVLEQYYPCTQGGSLTGYKIREVPKNFRSIGRTGAECELFGQFRFNRGSRNLLITEGECLLPTTEVLTEKGWVALKDFEGKQVMQANGEFGDVLAITRKNFSGKMIRYVSGSYELDMTPEHNMIRIDPKKGFIKVKANDITQKHKLVPRTVKFDSDFDNLAARLQVMFSADFTFRKEGDIYGALKKERKVERAKMLLNAAGVRYSCNKDSRGYHSFFIHRGHGLNVSKTFSYERDLKSAATIIDEVLFWDGNSVPNRNQIEYSSVIYENAKFIQTCAHLCGYVSTIMKRSGNGGIVGNYYEWFKVSILFGKKTSSTQKGFSEYEYNGEVMCLTTTDGTLMVRQNGSISLTGNCDQLSAYQMLKDYYKGKGSEYEVAVVSATTGVNSQKQIAAQYDFFDSFENIILGLDNDEAGQKAIESYVKVLPKGKVKVMKMRHKDANEYLQKGQEKLFVSDFFDAKTYVPVGVVGSNEISDAMREELDVPKIPLPPFMHQLQKMMAGGIPLGRIVNLGSASGTGKSTIVDELIYFWLFNSPHKCGIVTLESTVGQYGIKLLSRHLSKKLELLEREVAISFVNEEETKRKEHELFNDEEGNPRFYLADDRDGSVENIQDVIENLIISCNCKVIVCDPLHDIISMLPLEEQEKFMSWQKGMVKSHNVTFINVCHTRKTGNGQKAGSTGADLHEEDLMGNSSIYKSAACNLMFTRNKEAENEIERNVTVMKATKIRWTGNTGVAGKYYYDNQTHTLHDLDDWLNATGYTGLGEF